jgi:hypothetical protein
LSEKIYRDIPWWKAILTFQNLWSFFWIERKISSSLH